MERDEVDAEEVLIDYLNTKLREFEFVSSASKDKLKDEEQNQARCLKYLKSNVLCEDSDIKITKTWTMVHQKSWIIGICLRQTGQRQIKHFNTILELDSKTQLQYTTKLYTKHKHIICDELITLRNPENSTMTKIVESLENVLERSGIEGEWLLANEPTSESIVVVITDLPNFINQTSIVIEGFLTYEKSDKKYQLSLPLIKLSIDDLLSDTFRIKPTNIINGCVESYLSVISTATFTKIRIKLPDEIFRTIPGILQIDCNFMKTQNIGAGLILVYDGMCENLKESMVQVFEDTLKLITRNEAQLYLLYHHLYKNIPHVILLNEDCQIIENDNLDCLTRPTQSITLNVSSIKQTELATFAEALDRQMMFLEDKLQQCCGNQTEDVEHLDLNREDYQQFRKKLNDFEKETDDLYSIICKQNM